MFVSLATQLLQCFYVSISMFDLFYLNYISDIFGILKGGDIGSQTQGSGSNCANVIDNVFNDRWRCDETSIFGSSFETISQPNQKSCRQACMNHDTCLSFDFKNDADEGDQCRFYNEASLTHAYASEGKFMIGNPEMTTVKPLDIDTWSDFNMVEIDGSQTMPGSGIITSFSWYGSNTNGVTFLILRLESDNTYQVIGKVTAPSSTLDVENTITVSPPIAVQKGDVMGWTWEGKPAFGFDYSIAGITLYHRGDGSDGPDNVGDSWTFDKGPLSRRYHMSAAFVPGWTYEMEAPRLYCAAALCRGHCGPVMTGSTKTFAWGVYEGLYTLNWRPETRIPYGGDTCPSGIEAVKCWEDEENDVLWVYGVGGDTCHATCSLAGVTPDNLKCDASTTVDGFDGVSQIMSHFENPYNDADTDEFTCSTGRCWGGENWRQILIHEYNSNCYTSTNTEYTCDHMFKSINCFGERFNQLCPCVRGCSEAAGSSCVSIIIMHYDDKSHYTYASFCFSTNFHHFSPIFISFTNSGSNNSITIRLAKSDKDSITIHLTIFQ